MVSIIYSEATSPSYSSNHGSCSCYLLCADFLLSIKYYVKHFHIFTDLLFVIKEIGTNTFARLFSSHTTLQMQFEHLIHTSPMAFSSLLLTDHHLKFYDYHSHDFFKNFVTHVFKQYVV